MSRCMINRFGVSVGIRSELFAFTNQPTNQSCLDRESLSAPAGVGVVDYSTEIEGIDSHQCPEFEHDPYLMSKEQRCKGRRMNGESVHEVGAASGRKMVSRHVFGLQTPNLASQVSSCIEEIVSVD
eukprot:scaffold21426_cov68-Cylindrotheca_fusiformis.AAC.2